MRCAIFIARQTCSFDLFWPTDLEVLTLRHQSPQWGCSQRLLSFVSSFYDIFFQTSMSFVQLRLWLNSQFITSMRHKRPKTNELLAWEIVEINTWRRLSTAEHCQVHWRCCRLDVRQSASTQDWIHVPLLEVSTDSLLLVPRLARPWSHRPLLSVISACSSIKIRRCELTCNGQRLAVSPPYVRRTTSDVCSPVSGCWTGP